MSALVITDSRNFPGCLTITHAPTDLVVMDGFLMRPQAEEALARLLPLVNWQQDATALGTMWKRDMALRRAVLDIAGSYMGVLDRMLVLSDLTFRPEVPS